MLKPDQVPKEAVEAARKFMRLQALSDEWIDDLLAAAINAWPGMVTFTHEDDPDDPPHIILPLNTEPRDDAV